MNITNISVSRKSVWDTCQQKYKYQYHLKLETNAEEPFYFTYGTIIHKIAQEYVEAGGEKLISEVANDVLKGKILLDDDRVAPPLPSEYKKKIAEHLSNIKKLTDQTGFGGELEYPFKYDLDPPNKKLVLGFIDRLIIKENKAWILDYKTTKKGFWRKGPKDIKSDLQLRCYARVVQKEFGIPPENIKAALYYLDGGELVGASFSEQSLLAAEKELLDTYHEIERMDPDKARGKVGDHCKRCDWAKLCPFYSLT